jgi:hypothetical protein
MMANGNMLCKPLLRNYDGVHVLHQAVLNNTWGYGERGSVGMVTDEIKYQGWSKKSASPFWDLLWMRPSFYQCFGICLLHLELLGLVKVLSILVLYLFINLFFACSATCSTCVGKTTLAPSSINGSNI